MELISIFTRRRDAAALKPLRKLSASGAILIYYRGGGGRETQSSPGRRWVVMCVCVCVYAGGEERSDKGMKR